MSTRIVGRLVLMAAVVGAVAAPAAWAGGFATVGLDSSPKGVGPGEPWTVEVTVLQHGVTLAEGLKPKVVVTMEDGAATRTFPAAATGRPGVYRARVVFPSTGRWRYAVDDGFSGVRHSFAPVRIERGEVASSTRPASSAPVADDGASLWAALGAAALAGLAAGLLTLFLQRSRGSDAPAPVRG